MRVGSPFGLDLFGHDAAPPTASTLARDFTFPPFSVLDARSSEWQTRKRAWLARGIDAGDGRPARATWAHGGNDPVTKKIRGADGASAGTSVFDPVLAEMVYRWFCPPRGHVFDPFAGGSARGVVAVTLGLEYTGIDVREEQVTANRDRAAAACSAHRPNWIVGDSRRAGYLTRDMEADLVFSCPPYADLERYSDHEADLSAMTWPDFREAYRAIVAESTRLLRPDRFACFVVGDVRDRRGAYRNLPGETVAAFSDAGCRLYNEAILVTNVGSLSLRARNGFSSSRKLGKAHQNVLVFVKGDPRAAAIACERVRAPEVA